MALEYRCELGDGPCSEFGEGYKPMARFSVRYGDSRAGDSNHEQGTTPRH